MDNTIFISLKGLTDRSGIHSVLKEALDFPDYYGNNLDALNDELTSITSAVNVVLMDWDLVPSNMEAYVKNLINVFETCSKENPHFSFSLNERISGRTRRQLAVCGVWEDAENLNSFLRSIQSDRLFKNYMLSCFTFPRFTQGGPDNTGICMRLIDIIVRSKPCGIVIFAEMIKNPRVIDRLIEEGRNAGIPVFALEREHKGVINIVLDHKDAFGKIVEHVIEEHGAKRLDMFAGFPGNSFSNERIEVFKKVLKEHDIDPESAQIHYGDFWDVPARMKLDELLDGGYELPDAIICANDAMAIGVCDSLKKHGFTVPDDVIVTGFDCIWQALYHNPALTTAMADYGDISDYILNTVETHQPFEDYETIRYPVKFRSIFSQSCGCMKSEDYPWAYVVSGLADANHDYFSHHLEMGRFLSSSIGMNDVDDACSTLLQHLWLWNDQYYFIGLEKEGYLHASFHGMSGRYNLRNRYYNLRDTLPDSDYILSSRSGYNVLLFTAVCSGDRYYGYVCSAYAKLDLRCQQRFEEFAGFLSAVIHAVTGNGHLLNANREIEMLSEKDYLTELYNRRGFFKALSRVREDSECRGSYITFFSIDMDGLKKINDNYGHAEGDIAIKALADAIQTVSQSYRISVSSRYGGDEFALFICDDKSHSVEVEAIRERIENNIAANPDIESKEYEIRISIGAADTVIDDNFNIEGLMNVSDKLMYEDKASKRK